MPIDIPFPGLDNVEVPTAHAVALTERRIVASYYHTAPSSAAQHANVAPKAGCKNTRSRKRARVDEKCNAHVDSSEAASTLAGAQSLAAIMQLEASSCGTLQDLHNLIEACTYYLANEVISNAPDYMAPALANAPLPEVRTSYAFACSTSATLPVLTLHVAVLMLCSSMRSKPLFL